MEPSETPTLDNLARLLETAAGGDRHAGARETARWLIEETAGGVMPCACSRTAPDHRR